MTWRFPISLEFPKGQLSYVERWPMTNAHDILFVLCTYLLFVFKVGPYVMEKRTALQIKEFLLLYNGFKVVNSVYLAYKFLSYILVMGLFPKHCEYDDSTIYTIATLYWKYMVTKIIDLFDTIFFVVRKKTSQVTFLHVYHHVFMVIFTLSCLRYDPSDHWAFMAVMNCSIHAVMYTYYGISALGPKFSKYLWWKKYLTVMQLIQFILVIAHATFQKYTSRCPMHPGTYWIGLTNTGLFAVLFSYFYKRRYQQQFLSVDLEPCSKQS